MYFYIYLNPLSYFIVKKKKKKEKLKTMKNLNEIFIIMKKRKNFLYSYYLQ